MPESVTICRVCRQAFRFGGATPGVCFACDHRARRGGQRLAVPDPDREPGRQDVPRFTCGSCRETMPDTLRSGDICLNCARRDRAILERRLELRRRCGVKPLHSHLLAWDGLKGPPAYMQAITKLRAFLGAPGGGILALGGKRGNGKSQLGATAVWNCVEAGRSARIIVCMMMMRDLTRRYSGEGDALGLWVAEWAGVSLLVIDELPEFVGSDHTRASFITLIDERYMREAKSIIIGNFTRDQYPSAVGESVADRTNEGAGGFLSCTWASFRTGGADDPNERR